MGRKAKASAQRGKQRPKSGTKKNKSGKGDYTGEDFAPLVRQLHPLGLAVRSMDTDGNCLFRAVADQLCGDCGEHARFREECCDYMIENAEELRVFHADEDFEDEEESFEAYVEHMRSPARWGSQLELMALCRRHEVNAIVHQHGLPAYEMVFAPAEARCIQVSYHDGEHYNSVRFASDMEAGRPAIFLSLQEVRSQAEASAGAASSAHEKSAPADPASASSAPPPAVGEETTASTAASTIAPVAEPADGEVADAEAALSSTAEATARPCSSKIEKRRAKEAKERARREKKVSSTGGASEEAVSTLPGSLALLSKQLLTV